MADYADLNDVNQRAERGIWPPLLVVADMAAEIAAWRAAYWASGEALPGMQETEPVLVVATVEAHRATARAVLAAFGFPALTQEIADPSQGPMPGGGS